MKKNMKYLLALVLLIPATVFGQNVKFGHINIGKIYSSMPGIDTAKTNYQAFYADLEAEGTALSNEFEKAYTAYEQKRATYSPAVAKVKEQELQQMLTKIKTFQAEAEAKVVQHKEALIIPFQEKILQAVKEVAKEENYTYIFNAETIHYGTDSEDIAEKVKKKLGIQ